MELIYALAREATGERWNEAERTADNSFGAMINWLEKVTVSRWLESTACQAKPSAKRGQAGTQSRAGKLGSVAQVCDRHSQNDPFRDDACCCLGEKGAAISAAC